MAAKVALGCPHVRIPRLSIITLPKQEPHQSVNTQSGYQHYDAISLSRLNLPVNTYLSINSWPTREGSTGKSVISLQ